MTHEMLEKLGRAYCKLNTWEWDDFVGPKPIGFDDMTWKKKQQYIDPIIASIEEIIGEAGTNRAWWLYQLNKTEEDWVRWYIYDKNVYEQKIPANLEFD